MSSLIVFLREVFVTGVHTAFEYQADVKTNNMGE